MMTPRQALNLLKKQGVMLEAARGPVPNLADVVAGESRSGSWWTHPRGREIFAVTRSIRDAPEVLICRLIGGHITYVHRRLWPALVRLSPKLRRTGLARVREVHTRSGAHRIETQPFPRWVPPDVRRQAAFLTDGSAARQLGDWITPLLRGRARQAGMSAGR
jgi:hypothetical protein